MIGSLKKALQPSVTDLELDFDLPSGFEAFQAPSGIPTLFNGDKVVIYGILKTRAATDSPLQSGVQGKASLKGQASGENMTHSISFDIPAPPLMGEDQLESSTGFDMPMIHHLAAKSLLSDWKAGKGWGSTALTQEREQESVNISIESSVICEHTAFVAVDQEKQPLEGAITMYDITASMIEEEEELFMCSSSYSSTSPPLQQPYLASNFALSRSGGSFCSSDEDDDEELSLNSSSDGGALPPPPIPMALDLMLRELSAPPPSSAKGRFMAAPPPPAPLSSAARNSPPGSYDFASNLISLQHASGYWLLKDISEKIMMKSLPELQCPSGVTQQVWATILALVFLELKLGHQKDEWELIAAKAEMWLSSQSLPSSLESLKQKAKTLF